MRAFDTVNRTRLLNVCEEVMGSGPALVRMVAALLTDTSLAVRVGPETADAFGTARLDTEYRRCVASRAFHGCATPHEPSGSSVTTLTWIDIAGVGVVCYHERRWRERPPRRKRWTGRMPRKLHIAPRGARGEMLPSYPRPGR